MKAKALSGSIPFAPLTMELTFMVYKRAVKYASLLLLAFTATVLAFLYVYYGYTVQWFDRITEILFGAY